MGLYQVLHQVRVGLGVMAVKGYSTLPKSSELEPRHQMRFCILPKTTLLRTQSPTFSVTILKSWVNLVCWFYLRYVILLVVSTTELNTFFFLFKYLLLELVGWWIVFYGI